MMFFSKARKKEQERQGVVGGGLGCNPSYEGSIPSLASKHLEEIARQLKRIADLYEQEINVKRRKEGR